MGGDGVREIHREKAAQIVEAARELGCDVADVSLEAFRGTGRPIGNQHWGPAKQYALTLDGKAATVEAMDSATAPGFTAERTTTLNRDRLGRLVWVRSRKDAEDLAIVDRFLDKARGIKPLRRRKAPQLAPAAADLANAVMVGDNHMAVYCAARVSGEQWGRDDAVAMGQAAIDTLLDRLPDADVGVFIDCGDWLHAANPRGTTVKGTPVDTDGLFFEALEDGLMLKVYMVDAMLRKHREVHLRSSRGNHGGAAEIGLDIALAAWFRNNDRVKVDAPAGGLCNPAYISTFEWGNVLLAMAHGDQAKIKDVLGMVSNDHPKLWGRTTQRWAIGGHTHHYESDAVHGGQWESYPILAPRDGWHAANKWRSWREMHAVTYHRKWGRHRREVVTAAELRAIMDAHEQQAAP